MITLIYDSTFEGLLTAVFDFYEQKISEVNILPSYHGQNNLFGETRIAITDDHKSSRVWEGLKNKISPAGLTKFYRTFLSELPGMENKLLRFIKYALDNKINIENDYGNDSVRFITDTAKKVHREKHRMEAFVRFKLSADNLYYSTIEPDFNVIPLIASHFEKRYADQRWLIYDRKRKYGLYYDLNSTQNVEFEFNEQSDSSISSSLILNEKEDLYQQLWKNYFDSVNIKARKNMKLHVRHMPYRYWKYLTEKTRF